MSLGPVGSSVSLLERLARLFREPADGGATAERVTTVGAPTGEPSAAPDDPGDEGRDRAHGDDASDTHGRPADEAATGPSPEDGSVTGTNAVAVVVQNPSAGVRRFELTVRAGVPIAGVDPGLLTSLFESFDEGPGTVRARAVDVDGKGTEVEAAAPLVTVRFAEPVDPDSVSVDGTIDGHDEEPVPWSRVRLTPVD